MFNIGVAYRLDNRFNQDSGLVGFSSPDRRLLFRFAVNAIRIFDLRSSSTSSSPYSVSFGVQTEKGFGPHALPSGTTIIITGDIDLLKAIAGTPSP